MEEEQFSEGAADLLVLLVQARERCGMSCGGWMEVQGKAVLLPGQGCVTPEPAVGHLSC